MLLEDYALTATVAILVASTVILGAFLSRYARMVREAERSSRLAKDVWETMNARFGVLDTRIIDLMAKSEVLSSRFVGSKGAFSIPGSQKLVTNAEHVQPSTQGVGVDLAVSQQRDRGRTDTEIRVLQMLSEGPKSSAQIKDALGRSREHTARLMKALFNQGLVIRNDRNKPYVYEITDAGKSQVVR